MPLNPAESLVHELCTSSFFSLWSIANPSRPSGKELCDVLVVCDSDVIIWSVKEIKYVDTGSAVGLRRWQRKAIDESIDQLRGALRSLERMTEVSSPNAVAALPLPSSDRRKVHRIAVALGSDGSVPLYEPNAGGEHFHVMDESALRVLLQELDTITDFVDYLQAKEAFLKNTQVIESGGERDLLGLYLQHGRQFPSGQSLLIVDEGIWETLTAKPNWEARKRAEASSYTWDRIIETFVSDFATTPPGERGPVNSLDAVARTMARESRFARRLLADAFLEFMALASSNKIRARYTRSPSGVVYVFLATNRNAARTDRVAELTARCWVARGELLDATTVVGIATERYEGMPGFSLDAVKVHIPEWTEEHEKQKRYLRNDLGFFRTTLKTETHVDEYPNPQTGGSEESS